MQKHRFLVKIKYWISKKGNQGYAAWTFIETIIVIAIILVLTTTIGISSIRYIDQSKVAAARSQIEVFALALGAYYLDMGVYPNQSEGLEALWSKPQSGDSKWNGPYLSKRLPLDPWGTAYVYAPSGPNNLPWQIYSLGSDKKEGGEGFAKDIKSDE